MGVHGTVAVLLLCTGAAMQDSVLANLCIRSAAAARECLDTDNLSKDPESPESRNYSSPIDPWLIKYLNVHGVKQVVKCVPDQRWATSYI